MAYSYCLISDFVDFLQKKVLQHQLQIWQFLLFWGLFKTTWALFLEMEGPKCGAFLKWPKHFMQLGP